MPFPFMFNQLNQFYPELIAEAYDPDETTPLATLAKIITQHHEPNVLDGKSSFTGIVLKEEKTREPSKYYRVRIPELHAHLPIPNSIDPDSHDAQHIINLYPVMQVSDDSIAKGSALKPGSIIRSTFQDLNSLVGGIIDHVIDDSAGLTAQINDGYKKYFQKADAQAPSPTFKNRS